MKKTVITFLLLIASAMPVNADEARFLATLEKAEKGNAKAQNRLGTYYELGLSTEQSDVEAVKWFRKAAEQGYGEAQFNLGEMYERGRGVPQDIGQALVWYQKSCESGCRCGCRRLKKLKESASLQPQTTTP